MGMPGPSSCGCTGPDQFPSVPIAGAYGPTCGGCPPIAAVDPEPAADVAAPPGAEEDDAAAPAAEAPPFAADTGVADAAAGRGRRLAAGLREFEGRAGAVAPAVAAEYAVGAEIAGWWEVVERRDSVGEAARSGLWGAHSRVPCQQREEGCNISWGADERTFLSERHCASAG